ncbi:TonB family protein [Aquirhabdus parva]|uniref:TonB family protein n=1 Tax=Aquirhabdus parva TaxID=2283318 RepID=A0A345P9S9_9GAMM|nr:TonB family protein [Aquirhabdus parva]AXI04038.1 TonB family protein [Aquirhabdus parva]
MFKTVICGLIIGAASYTAAYAVNQTGPIDLTAITAAATQGNPLAQVQLGQLYEFGQGVSKDYAQALQWYRKSAEQGNAAAQFKLGFMSYHGYGVPQSYVTAVSWYRKAAAQNFVPAEHNLAFMAEKGLGMEENTTEAFNWLLMAAQQNSIQAQWEVGGMYEKGEGVAQNSGLAKFWKDKAVSAGFVPPVQTKTAEQIKAETLLAAQNRQIDPDRPQNIGQFYLMNNFHQLKIVKKSEPVYPKTSLANREFGVVIVWASVDDEGKVTNVTIHRSSGSEALDMAARDAVMHYVYTPYVDPDRGVTRGVKTEEIIEFDLPKM